MVNLRRIISKLQVSCHAFGPSRVHVQEMANQYIIRFEMRGAKKDDINLRVTKDYVRLWAKIPEELRSKEEPEDYLRSVYLPIEIDYEKAKAKYENGVLTVTLPVKGVIRISIEQAETGESKKSKERKK